MSLKFGIYLVEQRIISAEQFCGLVKIQQESTQSIPSLAIANNYLTIKQVSRILDHERSEGRSFLDLAVAKGLLEREDANHLVKLQEQSGESIQSLAIECGLLTRRQAEVLFNHFLRCGERPVRLQKPAVHQAHPGQSVVQPSSPTGRPWETANSEDVSAPAVAANVAEADAGNQSSVTPSPKFARHPIITVKDAGIQ